MTRRQTDRVSEFIKKMMAETEEAERKEREAFEKASSQEKIEKLRKYIDELDQRLNGVISYVEKVEEKLERNIAKERNYRHRIVSTETILCKAREGEVHNAILLVHEDGTITVRCSVLVCDCQYGLLES